MNIKEASILTGISKDMLRYYEKLGVLSPGRNPENGYREYTTRDLNDAVMIRQYSSLGLSLKTLSHLSRHGGTDNAIEQFSQAIDRLEMDLELAFNRLENAKDYHRVFDMLGKGKKSETVNVPVTYYYPRSQDHPFFAEMDPALYGAIRMVFRIEHADVNAETYPPGQGFLSRQLLSSCSIPYIEIPAHLCWFTAMEEEPEEVMNREKLAPVLEQMEAEGYCLHGDILLSQILNASDKKRQNLICIECDAGAID